MLGICYAGVHGAQHWVWKHNSYCGRTQEDCEGLGVSSSVLPVVCFRRACPFLMAWSTFFFLFTISSFRAWTGSQTGVIPLQAAPVPPASDAKESTACSHLA